MRAQDIQKSKDICGKNEWVLFLTLWKLYDLSSRLGISHGLCVLIPPCLSSFKSLGRTDKKGEIFFSLG